MRIPRFFTILVVGYSLASCGFLTQSIFNNSLADISILGINNAIYFGFALLTLLGINLNYINKFSVGLILSLFTIFILLFLVNLYDKNFNSSSIIIIGVILSMFYSSLTNFISSFNIESSKKLFFLSLGSFSNLNFNFFPLFILIFFNIFILILKNRINYIYLDEDSKYIGFDIKKIRILFILIICIMSSIIISLFGNISFLGLIIPNITKKFFKFMPSQLIIYCGFFGSIFLIICDLLSKILNPPVEIPINVITSLIGVVIFFIMFFNKNKLKFYD